MNKVILCGYLTARPELRETATKTKYTRFTIAVNRPKQQDKEQETDFINCIAWRGTGETISKYFDKGSQILVGGSIKTTKYDDKDGNKRTATDVVVDEFTFIGSKKEETKKEQNDPWQDFGDRLE